LALHTSQLAEFVEFANQSGGVHSEAVGRRYLPVDLTYETRTDETLSPFSEEYVSQQIALYEEISGRKLDQETGELHPFDIEPYIDTPNPGGSHVGSISEHVRALSTVLALACLGERPKVLDLGAGGGLSSEVYAYAGASVVAVDIDPLLGEMSRRRFQRMGLTLERLEMNFDDASKLSGGFQAAFFFQSFHHCMRPWRLIEDLSSKIDEDGVIAFTGEPMQKAWWKNWGIRLDLESLFVAREHGWFESGWSHDFIRECFSRAGFTLLFFSGGFGSEVGVATRDPAKLAAIRAKAFELDLVEREGGLDVAPSRYCTSIGERGQLFARPAILQKSDEYGALLFGPYVAVEPGAIEISLVVQPQAGDTAGEITIDCASDFGRKIHFSESISASDLSEPRLFRKTLMMDHSTGSLEVRAPVGAGRRWNVTIPSLKRL
jgi:2-polyprenyl-3-methyl-5-hydroxy-6-metoxy-1,4-benzoquinol methylase